MMLNPQPSDSQLAEIYGADYYLGDPSEEGRRDVSRGAGRRPGSISRTWKGTGARRPVGCSR